MKYQRLFRYLVLLLVLAGGILLYLQRQAALDQATKVLAQQLSALLGERVTFGSVELEVFTLSVHARDIRIDPFQTDAPGPLLTIDELSAQLESFPSSRQIHIRSILVSHPVARVDLNDGKLVHFQGLQELLNKPSDGKKGPRVDLDDIRIVDGEVRAADPVKGWSASLSGLQGTLQVADGKPGAVSLFVAQAEGNKGDLHETLQLLRVRADLGTTPARLYDLAVRVPGVELGANGSFRIDEPARGEPRALLNIKTTVDLSVINDFVADAPHLEGKASVAGEFSYVDDALHSAGDLKFEKVAVEQFGIGEGAGSYDLTQDRVRLIDAVLPRGDGAVTVNGELGFKDRMPLKIQAGLEEIQLADLFEDLGLKGPWVMMRVGGKVDLDGFIKRPFHLNGHAELEGKEFGVWSTSFHDRSDANHMMSLKQGVVTADVRIENYIVNILNASLVTDHSKIFLDGALGLNETMDLAFDAVDLDMSEISPLAGFFIAGRGWGKGRVVGPFNALVVSADASLFGARFDEYLLGDLEGRFIAPLNSSLYRQRLRSRLEAGRARGEAKVVEAGGGQAGTVGELAGAAGERAGAAGERAGAAGERAGAAGERTGAAGERAGAAGERTGAAGERAGAAGEQAGKPVAAKSTPGRHPILKTGPEKEIPLRPGQSRADRQRQDETQYPEEMATLEAGLETVDHGYYHDRLTAAAPAILMMPVVRTRIGHTRVYGQAAVIFGNPVTIWADLNLPPGMDGKAADGRLADAMAVDGVQLEGDPLNGALSGHIEVMGPPQAMDGYAQAVLTDGMAYGQPVKGAVAQARLEHGNLLVESLTATTGAGELALSGMIGRQLELQATAQLEGLPFSEIGALQGSELAAVVEGIVTVNGSFEAPVIEGQVGLAGMTYQGKTLGDTVLTLSTADESLKIQGLLLGDHGRVEADIGLTKQMPYDVRLAVSSMALDPYMAPPAEDEEATRVRVSGEARARGMLNGDERVNLNLRLDELAIAHGSLALTNIGPVLVDLSDGRYQISPVRFLGENTDLNLSGTIDAGGAVSLDLGGRVNLTFMQALTPGIFQRIEGQGRFSGVPGSKSDHFHIGGTRSALRFEGSLALSEAAFRTEYFPPTIDQLTGLVTISGNNQINITRLEGSLGGGTISGRGVMILGPEYYPRHYDLEVVGKDAFIQYPSWLPPGLMSATIKFNGDVGNLLMSGDVDLQRMVYRYRYNWEKILTDFRTYRLESLQVPVTEAPLFSMSINIHAPGTFYIRNNLGNVQLKGELQLVGNTNQTELRGDIESVRGTLNILDNNFELTDGKVEWTGDVWNPGLDMRLQTQIQSYTIYYQVSGTLQNWKLTPGSDSGLSERDINSLIAFRTLADNITEGREARAVLQPAAEFLAGRLGILEQLQAFTRLDRFIFSPATDQSGNIGARLYGEKELIPNKLFASGFYDYALDGNQAFLTDFEWRALNCCSLIFRLDNSGQSTTPTAVSPGARLKLKLEFE